jgi:hypothetical protein
LSLAVSSPQSEQVLDLLWTTMAAISIVLASESDRMFSGFDINYELYRALGGVIGYSKAM